MTEFGVQQTAAGPSITGFVGLVIQPDPATIRASYALAATLLPQDAEMALVPGLLPHVTLTQCVLREAPRARIAEFIARLEAPLRGRILPLRAVVTFGSGFVFWCVEETSPERALLQRAHEDAITVADGFLDPAGNAAVVEGTIRLTANDLQLVDNARTYGYAFIKDRYLPHITLGFDPRLGATTNAQHPHAMTVEHVVLARFGAHGRVAQVLTL